MSAAARIFEHSWERKPQAGPTPRPAGVRIATEADELALFDLLVLLAAENALAPMSDFKVRAMIRALIARKDGSVIGVVDGPDRIVASIGMVLTQWWYSEAWHVEDVWNFVHPEHRHDGFDKTYVQWLLQFSKWWSEQMGAPVLMGVLSTKRTIGKIKLYAREIPLVGALYLWRGVGEY